MCVLLPGAVDVAFQRDGWHFERYADRFAAPAL